jgi:hypothetical protein
VTEAGLAAIEAALAVSRRRTAPQQTKATGKPPLLLCGKSVTGERGARARKSSNLLPTKSTASFGVTISLRTVDGREQSFRIVGEDEADPSHGTVSYVSPLARAVLTLGPGETVGLTGGEAVILGVR